MKKPSPLHMENGKWFFWDETWADRYGPFETEIIAQLELLKYYQHLG